MRQGRMDLCSNGSECGIRFLLFLSYQSSLPSSLSAGVSYHLLVWLSPLFHVLHILLWSVPLTHHPCLEGPSVLGDLSPD